MHDLLASFSSGGVRITSLFPFPYRPQTLNGTHFALSCILLVSSHRGGDWICRVPSEGDIKELSPSLADALLLARSVRNLCTRHRSKLAVPLGWLGRDYERGYDNKDEVTDADAQLWINDQLSDVSGV